MLIYSYNTNLPFRYPDSNISGPVTNGTPGASQ
jgi:hypothetical protein